MATQAATALTNCADLACKELEKENLKQAALKASSAALDQQYGDLKLLKQPLTPSVLETVNFGQAGAGGRAGSVKVPA